jgi:hypothetical protein
VEFFRNVRFEVDSGRRLTTASESTVSGSKTKRRLEAAEVETTAEDMEILDKMSVSAGLNPRGDIRFLFAN